MAAYSLSIVRDKLYLNTSADHRDTGGWHSISKYDINYYMATPKLPLYMGITDTISENWENWYQFGVVCP